MPPIVNARKVEIEAACRRFGVTRLDLFGSATGSDFDPASSDLDFLVSFNPSAKAKAFDNYFGLRERLEEIFQRRVDLLTEASIKNPFLARAIREQRQAIYAA